MEEKLLDVGAERAVLSGLLQYGVDAYVGIADFISVDSFVNANNAIIFQCIEHIINNDQSPDIATLLAAAEQLKHVDKITTPKEKKLPCGALFIPERYRC